jgi:signal transduction histidine kinase/FixJ family two-component response regulator
MAGDFTSAQPAKGRRALKRTMLLGRLVLFFALLGSALLLWFTAHSVDTLQAGEERVLVQHTLDRYRERVIGDVTTVSVWDQGYRVFHPGGDLEWADSEIGSYFANNRGHEITLAIDENDKPFYGWTIDRRADPQSLAGFEEAARPLIAKVRAAERSGKPTPILERGDPGFAQTAAGVVLWKGTYYLAAVSNVVPETAEGRTHPGTVVIISAERFNEVLGLLGDELRVRKASILPAPLPHDNSIPIQDVNGNTIGVLDWQPKRPGMAVLRTAMPLVGLGLLSVLLLAVSFALHVRGIAEDLEAEELGHQQAVRDLIHARDRAEAANLAKSQFLANMSHEIRTPLNGILGMVQVMERSKLGEPHAERLEIIRQAGETLLSVLNGILDLSKVEAGRFELDIQEFDLADMAGAACKPFANLAAQKDIDFDIDIDPDALGIWRGDAMRLRQVLSNLTANAVKFTNHGGVRVRVRATAKGLAFTVSDTGIGIPSDRVSELFEKFVQADSSMSRKFGGTGLGLAICREFVDIMGGRLAVQTQEGLGSTFAFELPLPRVRDAAPEGREIDGSDADLPPIRILAAEDSKPNQLVLKALLEPLGLEVDVVPDGQEAVRAFKENNFDLVLMDVQMPNMNGVEATMAIRAFEVQEDRGHTPILALSANVMNHQLRDYAAAGMDGCVAKPIDASALIDAIRGALNIPRPAEPAEEADKQATSAAH